MLGLFVQSSSSVSNWSVGLEGWWCNENLQLQMFVFTQAWCVSECSLVSLWVQQTTFNSYNLLDVAGLMSWAVYRVAETHWTRKSNAVIRFSGNVPCIMVSVWFKSRQEHLEILLPPCVSLLTATNNNVLLSLLFIVPTEVPVLLFPQGWGCDWVLVLWLHSVCWQRYYILLTRKDGYFICQIHKWIERWDITYVTEQRARDGGIEEEAATEGAFKVI